MMKNSKLVYIVGSLTYLGFIMLMVYVLQLLSGEGNYDATGTFSLATSIGNVFLVVSCFGVRAFQVTDTKDQISNDSYYVFRIIMIVVSSIVCLVITILLHYSMFQILCINFYNMFMNSYALTDLYHGILQKHDRLRECGISLAIRGALSFLAFLLVIITTNNLLYSIIAISIVGLLMSRYDRYLVNEKCNISMTLRNPDYLMIKQLLRKTSPLFICTVCNPIILAAPKMILEKMAGSSILGIYSLIFAPTSLASSLFSSLLAPYLNDLAKAKEKNDSNSFVKAYRNPMLYIAVIGIVFIIGIYFLGTFALTIVYDKTVAEYNGVFMLSMVVNILIPANTCIGNGLIALRSIKDYSIITVLGAVIIIAGCPILITQFGIYGICFALIFGLSVQLALLFVRLINERKKYFS